MSISNQNTARWVYLLGSMSCAGLMSLSPITYSLAADADGASGTLGLETITVTAQRREEDSQTVPIAISTISGEDLELRGADSLQSLSATVPGFSTAGSLWVGTYVRGVGSTSASANNEPSVATYVDGVYNPSSYALTGFAFNNIERLEVLKGPQGTLFGRNATGGIVQIITSDPKHELGGNVSLGYGNYETVNASVYLTGGITDDLAADLAVGYEDQGAGFGYNPTRRTDTYLHENLTARSKWLYTPSDSTKIGVSLDFSEFTNEGFNNQQLPGSVANDGVSRFPGKYNAVGDEDSGNDNETYGASMRIDQDFGALHGASITAYRNVDAHWRVDNDNTPNNWVVNNVYSEQEFVTQELQLSNANPGRVQWLAGAFYYVGDFDNLQVRTGQRVSPGQYTETYGTQQTESLSGYGQATAEIFADTKLTLGLRYTDETLEFEGRQVNRAGAVYGGPFKDETSYDPWTWRVALDHQFTSDVMGYVSYNHGFKSGAYNLTTPSDAPLRPEDLDAYEVGLKSEFMDNRVRLNVAAFYYEYNNLQVSIAAGGGGQIFKNAAARNYGLDAGVDFAATENLTLSMGVGLLSAEYTYYPNAQGYTPTGTAILIADAKGRDLPNSPPVSGYVSANYRVPTSIGEFRGTASLSYSDSTYVVPVDLPVRPSYELLNASVEWRSQSKSFGVRVWGKNLTDAYYGLNIISNTSGWIGNYSPPRTYGITLLQDF
jgi:iron complex outermembrane receptor protein